MKTSVLVLMLSVSLIGCTGQVLNKNPNDGNNPEEVVNNIELLREYQRVIRLGCHGVVKSDKIETVRSPTHTVEIHPNSWINLHSSEFVNTTTNSRPAIVGHTKFNIDYAHGYFNMYVVSGRNVVSYKFHRCSEWVGVPKESECRKQEEYESGIVILNVGYTERLLEGTRTYNECPESI